MQRLIEVTVEKMSLGGNGIARHQGLVLFIPFSAPGDVLKVEIINQKKNFAEAKIIEILNPSEQRRVAPCPVYGKCGGCNWQHIDYKYQLQQKQKIVEEQLLKFLGTLPRVLPIISSPNEWNYRNRIQIKQKNGKIGFFAKGSHDLVEINNCLIAEDEINQKLNSGALPDLERIELASENDSLEGFSQVNSLQNVNLIQNVLEWAGSEKYTEIYDLYCGGGNFTFPLMGRFPLSKIMAVELSPESVKKAQKIIEAKNISSKKVQFILSDVGFFLKRIVFSEDSLVLLDPPRAGCDPLVIQNLAHQNFKKLLYISCNPSTLGRDLQALQKQSNSKIIINKVQPFDMFPQTDHIEVLVELFIDRK